MRFRLATFLCGLVLVVAPSLSAATLFNVRASLENRYYIAGTVSIDPALGLVTGQTSTLFRDGVAVSNFGGSSSQGPFSPGGGIAPSYLFASPGSGGYAFVGAVPGTSLVGYSGGELCGVLSASRCAFADVFQGGVDIANVVQGILLPASDHIQTFALTGTFENGDNVTGTVVIDTTAGYVLDEHATLFSHGVVVDEYFGALQSIFAPGGGVSSSYLLQSTGLAGVLLNLGIPGTSLVNYAGGNLCATGNGLTCAYSNLFSGPTFLGNAIAARLDLVAAVPEPSTVALLAIGLVGIAARRRASLSRR